MNCLQCQTDTVMTRDGYCPTCKPEKWELPSAKTNGKANGHAHEAPLRQVKARKLKPKCRECGSPVLDGDRPCSYCAMHKETRLLPQVSLEFDPQCMHGWLGEYARKLACPLSAAYPAVLAVAAGYGVPDDPRVRATLFVTLLGRSRSGKSATKNRAISGWMRPPDVLVRGAYPGSEIGLIQILGGKRMKEGADHDLTTRQVLLTQDELGLTFKKGAIQNSGLPNAFNEMFYSDVFETAAKGGAWVCDARLSMLGCLTCSNPDEFAEIFGADTVTGLYGRQIFGLVPSGWDFQWATYQTPMDGLDPIQRGAGRCVLTTRAFQMVNEWASVDPAGRVDLRELALRVALITSSLNHDDEVTEESVVCALRFMEWQQRIRAKYRPSEMDSPSGKCQQAIVRALGHYEDWVPWRDLCRNHDLYGNKSWDAKILNSMKRAMIFEGMLEEELGEDSEGKREKTGRIRLAK